MKYVLYINWDDGERIDDFIVDIDSIEFDKAITEAVDYICRNYYQIDVRLAELHEVANTFELDDRLEIAYKAQAERNERLRKEAEANGKISEAERERAEYERLKIKYECLNQPAKKEFRR